MGASNSTERARFVIPPSEDEPRSLRREGQGDAPGLGDRASVLVWNVRKERTGGFAEVYGRLARGRHLLLLQEVHLCDGAEDILLGSGNHGYEMATSFLYRSDGSPTGVAIGSTARAIDFECQVTEDREPVVGTPKSSLIARYRVSGARTLLAATVHGLNRSPPEAFERQVDRLAERMGAHPGPILFAGDFNTQSARKLAYLKVAAKSLGMEEVLFDPDTRTRSKLSRRPLDHAFVRGARVEDAVCWDSLGGSDHVAMTFDLVIDCPAGSELPS